ncbi:MAG: hypothetical protein HYZ29_22570 [Myxococcales bacterium]|nr:hypothetical protein [Myxococcales bacterium]
MRRPIQTFSAALLLGGCSAEPAQPSLEAPCTVNQFRACETEHCRGAQQCVEPGAWSRCFCTVLDGSYPNLPDASDAASDSAPE